MEESAPKRRRISPRLSNYSGADQTQDALGGEPMLASSPRRIRPSFASPTRASISRQNPEIIEPRHSKSAVQSLRRLHSSQPSTSTSHPVRTFIASLNIGQSLERAANQGQGARARESGSKSPTHVAEEDAHVRPSQRNIRGTSTALPTSPHRPRPFPSRDLEADFNPFAGRELRRSGTTPEPILPPVLNDIVTSTPPKGIHSSPSRRWKRERAANNPKKTSPLKVAAARPGDGDASPVPSPRKGFSRLLPIAISVGDDEMNVRKIASVDVYSDQKKERDELRAELARLRSELAAISEENSLIRLRQKSGRNVASKDEKRILEILKRQFLPHDLDVRPQSQLLAMAALDPAAMLQYTKRPAFVPVIHDANKNSLVESHSPVQLTAAEELPFLQLFSPFNITSTLSTCPKRPDEPLRQLFSINLRSRHISGLFNAKMDVEVDAMNLTILSLNVRALEPSAKAELGEFIDMICNGVCNRTMQRNVGIVSWAMAEWLRVAEQRARFWAQLSRQTSTKTGLRETSRNARLQKPKRSLDYLVKDEAEISTSTYEILRFMGQQALNIELPGKGGRSPVLRLEWQIEIDWTGEAQSKLAVIACVPGEWHSIDQKRSLGKISSLFQTLVQGGVKPVVVAQKMISLLIGEI